MEQLQIFNNPDFGQIRTMEINSKPYFVALDVTKALGYSKSRNAIKQHVDEMDALKQGVPDNQGFIQNTTVINESGLYALIFASKLPTAKAFKRWVTNEVLPEIRKNGGYLVTKPDDTVETISERGQQVLQATVERLTKQLEKSEAENEQSKALLEEWALKVEYFNRALDADTLYSATQLAKSLRMEAAELNRRLHKFGIQYRRCGTWFLYANYVHYDLAEVRPKEFIKANGKRSGRPMLMWTEKGRNFVFDLIRSGKLNN